MKKRLILASCILAGLALILPGCNSLANVKEEQGVTYEDPISYSDEDKVVSVDKPYRVTLEDDDEFVRPNKLILHYHNDDNACLSRRFYTWVTGVDGIERKPMEQGWTSTDMAIELDFSVITDYADSISLFFIIKVAGTWSGQSEDTELKYENYKDAIVDGVLEVWTIPGEGTSIEIYRTEAETKLPKIQTAKFVDFKTIHCVCTVDNEGKKWVPINWKLYAFDKSYLSSTEASQAANKPFYLFKQGDGTTNEFDIKFNYTAKINVQYVIESWFEGYESKTQRVIVSYENLYATDRFEQCYTYSGNDLGATYTPTATTFKLWSPISAYVEVNIFKNGTPLSLGGSDVADHYKMGYSEGGVWELTILGDLKDKFYTFSLTNALGTVEAMDPYAKACGINGMRAYVYDKASADANPDGWDSVPAKWDGASGYDITNPQELSIYEIHVRDLTMDETWVSNHDNQRGTFNAFAEKGTRYSESFKGVDYEVKTGYDHIEELGVKAIQLLPSFDHDDDERPAKMKFNWGYNPLNYNCIEGGYSSDPYNPLARIKEFKNLVKAYSENANHTRVIMDVVYNHVSSAASSCFTKTMPKYYFRYDQNWNYEDGAGCSNEVRTEATMMRKYIVDSLCWWASEYKIKGFRFDLMGLIDVGTIAAARTALTAIDPDIYIYGEGWTSVAGYHGYYGNRYNNKGEQIVPEASGDHAGSRSYNIYTTLYNGNTVDGTKINGYIGGFNDAGRDAVKGGNDHGYGTNNSYPNWGFITQGAVDVGDKSGKIGDMLKGIHTGTGGNPNQSISYISCHDNYTVYDQVRYALANSYTGITSGKYDNSGRPIGEPALSDVIGASITAHAIVFASNAAAFIQGGEEIYRTKTISDVNNDAQGIKATPEYEALVTGGNDALVRPFPDYETYDPSFTAEALATGEVRMYGTNEMVSHNSYKLPDSVNSFKWDRKIHVGDELTYSHIGTWQKMVENRSAMKKYDYDALFDTSLVSSWSSENNGVIALWSRETASTGFGIIYSGREGGTLNWGGISIKDTIFTFGSVSKNGDNVTLGKNSFVIYRLNG